MLNSKSPVGTTDEKSTKDDVITSSPTCIKPIVVCSQSPPIIIPNPFSGQDDYYFDYIPISKRQPVVCQKCGCSL